MQSAECRIKMIYKVCIELIINLIHDYPLTKTYVIAYGNENEGLYVYEITWV